MHNQEAAPPGGTVPYQAEHDKQAPLAQPNQGIVIIYSDRESVSLNAPACRILGYSQAESLSLSIHDLLPARAVAEDGAHTLWSSPGAMLRDVNYLRCKNGRFLRVNLQYHTVADGTCVAIIQPLHSAETNGHKVEHEDEATLRARAQNFRSLAEASHEFAQYSRDYRAVLDLVTRKIANLLGDICSIRLLSEDEQWLDMVAIHGVDADTAEQFRNVSQEARLHINDQAHTRNIVETGQPLLWPHISMERIRNQAKPGLVSTLEKLGSHGLIIVPLWDHGRVMGLLYVLRYQPHQQRFNQDDVSLVQNLADRAASAIVNARLYRNAQDELERREQAEAILARQNNILEQIATGAPLSEILNDIVAMVEEQITGSICSILTLDQEGKRLYTAAAPGLPASFNGGVDGVAIGPSVGSCGTAAYSTEPVIVSDVEQDARWDDYVELARAHSLRACWSFPIFSSKQKVMGTFALYHTVPYVPSAEQQAQVSQAAHLAGVAMERDRSAQFLRESEEQFRALIDASAQIVWTLDADGEAVQPSPSWRSFTGQTDDESRGSGWQNAIHPDDGKATIGAWRKAREAQAPFYAEYRLRHASGEWRWMVVRSVPLFHESGTIRAWVGMNTDITDKKRAEEERQELEEQLHQTQKMESIGQLAGGVAHDFNNVLTVIQMYSDLLARQMAPDDRLRSKVNQIQLASQRAAALTGQLLAFSRKQMLNPTILNLNTLITELHTMLGRLIGEDISIVASLEPNLWSVVADPTQIEQVILNLVVNARDAMPTGGKLSITTRNVHWPEVSAQRYAGEPTVEDIEGTCDRCVALAVTDTGSGMDSQTQSRIFEPFFTTKSESQRTGLGLSTAHGIVKQSGGDIKVHSQPGSGASFTIYLPATMDTPHEKDPLAGDAPVQSGDETVLLVEDEAAVCALVRDTLAEIGYNVLEAHNGMEALALTEEQSTPIDLLLTDVVMPQMSGRELAEQLQTRQPHLKVLFMSGYTDDAVVRHGVLTAEVELLQKPFSASTLADKVRSIIDRQKS